jgi:hypothetical protein
MPIWRMRIACWIPNATDTHSECVILIAFQLQQWLQDPPPQCYVLPTLRVVFLRYIENTYTVCQNAVSVTVIVFVIVTAGI